MQPLVKLGYRAFALAILVLGTGLMATPAEASHFRYGTLSWEPTANAREISFSLTAAFRRTGYSGSGGDGDPITGDIITENIGATGLEFGDGTSTSTLRFRVVAYSVTDNFIIGVALNPGTDNVGVLHTYPSTGGPYTAGIDSCCRIGLNNRSSGSYALTTLVTFNGNRSPTSTLVPIVSVDENAAATFFVPASDSDGDNLRWRISTDAEAGGGSGPPGISVDANTGQVTWNNVGLNQTSFWTVQIIVEDLDGQGNAKTQTPVDFLLKIDPLGTTNTQPTCAISPTGPFTVNPGNPLSFAVTGTDPDAGAVLSLNTGGLPAGATMSPGLPTSSSSPVSSTFNWTPTAANLGVFNVIYSVTDELNSQTLCSVQIRVEQATTDTTAPVCGSLAFDMSGNGSVYSTVSDPESGIASVRFTLLNNLTGHVSGAGPFTVGPTYTVPGTPPSIELRGTRINPAIGRAGLLAVITNGAGLTRVCDPVVATLSTSAEATALLPPTPNPAAGSARVPFTLAESADVRIAVYDALGREVYVLADDQMSPGSYEVVWDGRDTQGRSLSTGVYLVRMTTGTNAQTQRITLLR